MTLTVTFTTSASVLVLGFICGLVFVCTAWVIYELIGEYF